MTTGDIVNPLESYRRELRQNKFAKKDCARLMTNAGNMGKRIYILSKGEAGLGLSCKRKVISSVSIES